MLKELSLSCVKFMKYTVRFKTSQTGCAPYNLAIFASLQFLRAWRERLIDQTEHKQIYFSSILGAAVFVILLDVVNINSDIQCK